MRSRKLTAAEKRATDTLVHYFKTTWERIGLQWRPDNAKEIESIITDVVDAAMEERKTAPPHEEPERCTYCLCTFVPRLIRGDRRGPCHGKDVNCENYQALLSERTMSEKT